MGRSRPKLEAPPIQPGSLIAAASPEVRMCQLVWWRGWVLVCRRISSLYHPCPSVRMQERDAYDQLDKLSFCRSDNADLHPPPTWVFIFGHLLVQDPALFRQGEGHQAEL